MSEVKPSTDYGIKLEGLLNFIVIIDEEKYVIPISDIKKILSKYKVENK